MHNNQKLKKLALISAEATSIPKDIENFVLKCLNKQDLKAFLHYYKLELDKKRVYVSSTNVISGENLGLIKKMYAGKDIITIIDENLGAGLKLKHDDLVVDFTFKKYINDTVEKLKN
ncbi:MAG: hypothetical protein Q7T54_04775 [Candidatus Levybacteria bacterium]|nr:hypothetical protein [Candidatus Levybacteria bacterium]